MCLSWFDFRQFERRQSSRCVFVPVVETSPPQGFSYEAKVNGEYSANVERLEVALFFLLVHCKGGAKQVWKRFLHCADEIYLFPFICVKERHSHEKFWANSQNIPAILSISPPPPTASPALLYFLFYAKRKQIDGSWLLRFHFLDQLRPLATVQPSILLSQHVCEV